MFTVIYIDMYIYCNYYCLFSLHAVYLYFKQISNIIRILNIKKFILFFSAAMRYNIVCMNRITCILSLLFIARNSAFLFELNLYLLKLFIVLFFLWDVQLRSLFDLLEYSGRRRRGHKLRRLIRIPRTVGFWVVGRPSFKDLPE